MLTTAVGVPGRRPPCDVPHGCISVAVCPWDIGGQPCWTALIEPLAGADDVPHLCPLGAYSTEPGHRRPERLGTEYAVHRGKSCLLERSSWVV